jgi:hypothetical protein
MILAMSDKVWTQTIKFSVISVMEMLEVWENMKNNALSMSLIDKYLG